METDNWVLRCAKRLRLAKGIGLSEIIEAAVEATHVTQPLPLVLVMDTPEPPIYICVNSINGNDIVLCFYLGLNLNFGEDQSETRERKVRASSRARRVGSTAKIAHAQSSRSERLAECQAGYPNVPSGISRRLFLGSGPFYR